MQIVTGRRGEPHVTSRQMQAVYRSFLGDFALLDVGAHLAATATSNDNVRISDGVVAVQGIYAVIAYNEYDDNYIEPVSVGMKRIDTLILHYTKSNDIEDMQIEVVEGEEAVDNPVAPTIAEGGDAWEGTADIKVPIYDVLVTSFGLTVTPYSRMNTLIPTLDSIAERIPETVVTGVKGDSEVLYRDGDVNITKANIGLGNVDNTADTDKPISTATQTALNLKADLTYVDAKISAAYHAGGSKTVAELTSALLIADNIGKVYNMSDSGVTTSDFVEGAGDPINEGDNVGICNVGTEESPIYKFDLLSGFVDLSAYATTSALNAGLAEKVDKVTGKGLSTEDYTDAEKQKLANIESNAQANVQSDWNEDDTEDDGYIKNKPDLSTSLTATGNPITIESSESNLVECTAEVEAVQDLHGYDHPWVGGAGKNKLPMTVEGIKSANTGGSWSGNVYSINNGTFEILTDSDNNVIGIKVNGTFNANSYLLLESNNSSYWNSVSGQSVTLNGCPSGGTGNTYFMNRYLQGSDNLLDIGSGVTYTNPSTNVQHNITINIKSGYNAQNLIFYPMIRLATETDSSFEPYSNICPIEGRTGAKVRDVGGENKFTDVWTQDKSFNTSGELIAGSDRCATINGNRIKGGTTYKFLYDSSVQFGTFFYDANDSFIELHSWEDSGYTFTTPSNAAIVRFNYKSSTAPTNTQLLEVHTATITFGETVYGGTVNFNTGKLMVTHGYVEFDGSSDEVWSLSGGGYRVTNSLIKDIVKRPSSGSATDIYLISNRFIQRSATDLYAGNVDGIGIEYDTGLFCAHYGGYRVAMTVADWKTWLSNNPLQVVYELATPYTIQLTPEQIRLLKGTNNISCNTGNLSIKYYPDNVLGQLKGDIEDEYDARLERLEQYTDVFGFIEDMDVLSPTERIKYIGKNENYEPLTVDLNTGSYTLGDWGDFPFLVDNKPYMVKPDGTPDYQLNEYDYTKKLDGTDSDVANEDYDGGAFSWGTKIYKKQWMVGNKRHVLFSFDKKDGFHADGFINKDGKELDGRWIPMFYGTVVNGKAKSIATGNCITGGNLTTDAQHNAIVAFDSDANFFGGAFVETLIDLLMMFAKNSDLQAAYGYGNSSGYVNDSSKNYGMLNNAVVGGGQFYGRSGGKTLNKALHSIVLATYNTYMRDPYEVIKNGEVVVSEDYTYDPTGATYTDTGITVPNQSANAWRYPKKYIAVPRYGSIPDISVGGASTSLGRADGTYTLANQSGAVIVCLRFGRCADGARAGLSCRAWDAAASTAGWDTGFALLLDGSAVA